MTNSAWIASLHMRADQPPQAPREALLVGTAEVGSIEPALAFRLVEQGCRLRKGARGWAVEGEPMRSLEQIALTLEQLGLGGAWRDERLAVNDVHGQPVASIERAAVRPLGIATTAVHLVGFAPDGRIWVQQRAHDKATDPGLWDTLAGGLVAADESVPSALVRETWEEAGIEIGALREPRYLGRTRVRRPVPQGYMVEWMEMYAATLPEGLAPNNRDGEVAGFACLDRAAIELRLRADAFTLEAALVLVAALH
jgi:8-oxo-dGTP pyrophosphatase MutT (NUDIX family)